MGLPPPFYFISFNIACFVRQFKQDKPLSVSQPGFRKAMQRVSWADTIRKYASPHNPDACFYDRRRYSCSLPVPFICCVQLLYPGGLGIYECFDIRRQGIVTISFRSLWKDGLHFLYRSCSLRMVSADPTGLSHRRLETPLAYVRALHRMIKDSFSAAVFSWQSTKHAVLLVIQVILLLLRRCHDGKQTQRQR